MYEHVYGNFKKDTGAAARRLAAFALVAALVIGFAIGLASGAEPSASETAEVEYATAFVSVDEDAGILFNRRDKGEPAPERTTPVDPAPATPTFEAEPIPPASVAVTATVGETAAAEVQPAPTDVLFTKTQIVDLLKQVAVLAIGAFLGSGNASPFVRMVLEKLLGAFGGATPTARVTRRAAKKKVTG